MSDEAKYIPKDKFPNTNFDWYADNNKGEQLVGVIPHLAPLLAEVINRYPQWSFVAISGNYHERLADGSRVRLATKFNVVEKREVLGYIGYDRSYSRGDQFVVGNDRISATKDRQAYTKTTKLDVALRLVKKNFSPKTNDEYFEKTVQEVSENLNRLVTRSNQDTRGYYNSLQATMAQYVRLNWDSFVSTLNEEGKASCAKYMEAHEKLQTNEAVRTAYTTGEASTILIKDNEYIIRNKGGTTVCPTEQLPQELKLKLGMLKLVAINTVVDGMGYRATEDSYVIV
jgi:hypothetical protein